MITGIEISVFKNRSSEYITSYFLENINSIHKNNKILYLSSDEKEEKILKDFPCLRNDNIDIIFIPNITLGITEKFLKGYDYIFINSFKLANTSRNAYVNDEKLAQAMKVLKKYEVNYNVKMFVAINET